MHQSPEMRTGCLMSPGQGSIRMLEEVIHVHIVQVEQSLAERIAEAAEPSAPAEPEAHLYPDLHAIARYILPDLYSVTSYHLRGLHSVANYLLPVPDL